jgi:hypothetical protein
MGMVMTRATRSLSRPTREFLAIKRRGLFGRTFGLRRLTPDTVGLRAEDRPFAPTEAHFRSANRRLSAIDRAVQARLRSLPHIRAEEEGETFLQAMAMVERELDRLRRAFGLFFEIFAQRGTAFASALAAHDVIARDCYAVVRKAAPQIFSGPLISPLTYLEHGYSPATMRRGVTLSRLLGESNPFPLIRIPYDRDQPWQAVFLHEVAHNLQADLGLWVENKNAVIHRLAEINASALCTSIFGRWHKEIFADLAALLLGGPAVAWGLAEFLAHPSPKVMTYRPGGPHPVGYMRVLILAHMLDQMGFPADARRLGCVWKQLYSPARGHRIPAQLLKEAGKIIPAVVDEIAYQPRRALAERSVATVIPFTREDQARIRRAGLALCHDRSIESLPLRHLVCAAHYAIENGVDLQRLQGTMVTLLTSGSQVRKFSSQAVAPGLGQVTQTAAA